eukprot:844308_1
MSAPPDKSSPHFIENGDVFCCKYAARVLRKKGDPQKIPSGVFRCPVDLVNVTAGLHSMHQQSKDHRKAIAIGVVEVEGSKKNRKYCERWNEGFECLHECRDLHACSCCGCLYWCAEHCQNRRFMPVDKDGFLTAQ